MNTTNGRNITDHFDTLRSILEEWQVEPFFVTVTGVDQYGFPSADSDYDLRGAFNLPWNVVLGLEKPETKGTINRISEERGLEVDLVAHDIAKYAGMLADSNAAIIEETLSPHVLQGSGVLDELREITLGCVTRHVYYHYNGFSRSQINEFWNKEEPRRLKTLLYIYRILMTGIHALETGEVECHLPTLNERFRLPFIPDLIAAKVEELSPILDADWDTLRQSMRKLQSRLHRAHRSSPLPNEPTTVEQLSDLLVQLRLSRVPDTWASTSPRGEGIIGDQPARAE